jgi:lysine-specific demethylase/histidyl-hydroxylase NO66
MLLMTTSSLHRRCATTAAPRGGENVAVDDALTRFVGDVEHFATDHWGRAPLLRRNAGPFDDLLDVAAVETLLTDLARRPTFRLIRDGSTVPVAEYTLRTRVGGDDVDDVADVDKILELVAGGATVVMQGLQRFWPPLAMCCLEVEDALGHAVQANAYLSPQDSAGLARHHDDHAVIALQVQGSKHWDIEGIGATTLDAGDVVYLPAGTTHSARTSGAMSLHITLGLLTTTYRQVVQRAVDALGGPDLDRPLPIGWTTGAAEPLAAELGELFGSFAAELTGADTTAIATAEVRRRQRRARRRWLGRLQVAVDPDALGPWSIVRCRRRITWRLDDDALLLDAPDRTLRMPLITEAAVAALATGELTRVGDLPLAPDAQLVVARRLVREGVLEVVDKDAG